MKREKKIVIIAGPNGAGKTTFAREFLANEAGCLVFVGADFIAVGLAPTPPPCLRADATARQASPLPGAAPHPSPLPQGEGGAFVVVWEVGAADLSRLPVHLRSRKTVKTVERSHFFGHHLAKARC